MRSGKEWSVKKDANSNNGGQQHDRRYHVKRVSLVRAADECRQVMRRRRVQSIDHYFYPHLLLWRLRRDERASDGDRPPHEARIADLLQGLVIKPHH